MGTIGKHFHIPNSKLETGEEIASTVIKTYSVIAEHIDKHLEDRIIEIAQSEGITDVYVLDRHNIVDAIQKTVATKPELEADGYDENGELIYDTGYCPKCRHEFEVYYDSPTYCPDCGQKLDWSEVI